MKAISQFPRDVCAVSAFAIAVAVAGPGAIAQEFTMTCQNVGGVVPEVLGDREGHSITTSQGSCRVDSGPLADGVLTGTAIYEWDKTNGVLLSGSGVIRKPGSTVVFQDTEGKLSLTITDGKVVGFTGSGRGTFPIAVGGAAPLAKSWTYTVKSTGPGQYTVEHKGE